MSIKIPSKIEDDEILVHYIYDRNFTKRNISEDKLVAKDIFLPNKGGVSLQRYFFCDENSCKSLAKTAVLDRVYIGFLIFRKSKFISVKKEYIETRKEFEADIISTPLDIDFKYLPIDAEVYTDTPGNPAHADLKYQNPAVLEGENPNTAIRSFSRKLSKVCELVIDLEPKNLEYEGLEFKKIV